MPSTGGPEMSIPVAGWLANAEDWDGALRYGPAVPDERNLRLLGNLAGKRVLLLGCGVGQVVAEVAATGAKVIGVEPRADWAQQSRDRCLERGLMVEVHESELAELAFVRADTIDVALSVLSLAAVADLGRVFRQVHRVLRPDGPLVLSLPHPTQALLEGAGRRAHDETAPRRWEVAGTSGTDHTHTIESVFTALTRTGFRVDNLAELMARRRPGPDPFWDQAMERAPAVLVVRARKAGARAPTA
jgi:SAM-dependent methyltransferase